MALQAGIGFERDEIDKPKLIQRRSQLDLNDSPTIFENQGQSGRTRYVSFTTQFLANLPIICSCFHFSCQHSFNLSTFKEFFH